MPTWIQLVFLACGVCFILALKGLSGPKTARNGNLLGAGAAVVACAMPFFWTDLHLQHVPLILGAIIVTGTTDDTVAVVVGLIAIMLAAVNMIGGFVVTDRMLQMFTRKKPAKTADSGDTASTKGGAL